MNPKKQSRRKPNANKLEPIDWREFANDAVLNGNMSTLYRRPASEDASAYASPEAMIEIEKRVVRTVTDAERIEAVQPPSEPPIPTVGIQPPVDPIPTEGTIPTMSAEPSAGLEQAEAAMPTICTEPTVGPGPSGDFFQPAARPRTDSPAPTAHLQPTAGPMPTVDPEPTVGTRKDKKVKPIRTVHDALTLAGQVLYRAMLSTPDAPTTTCTKGYRQLAAETHLDKDTVRDLIVEFKHKGILYETATYDPDTRLSKTYAVLSPQAVLRTWRESGILFVTAGRQRPLFCSPTGNLITFTPTAGRNPTA